MRARYRETLRSQKLVTTKEGQRLRRFSRSAPERTSSPAAATSTHCHPATDDQRFVMLKEEDEGRPIEVLRVVVNWTDELKSYPRRGAAAATDGFSREPHPSTSAIPV